MKVTDAAGSSTQSDSKDGEFTVTATALSLTCYADPVKGDSPLNVDFRAVVDGNVGPAEVIWDFVDGESSNQRITSHVYILACSAPGPVKAVMGVSLPPRPQPRECTREYVAVATVSDGLDRSFSCSRTIKVKSQSEAPPVVTLK